MKSDVLEKVAEEIFKYKAYPTDSNASLNLGHTTAATGGSRDWKQRWATTKPNLKAMGVLSCLQI